MDLTLYNKSWLVPAKCGTRHIDSLLDVQSQVNTQYTSHTTEKNQAIWLENVLSIDSVKMMIPSEQLFQYRTLPITHIVLREPMDFLESALHTDLSGHHTTIISKGGGFKSTNSGLMEWLLPYTYTGTGHWSPTLYKGIWYLLQIRKDIQIVPLNQLSRFLSEQGIEGEYIASDFNFSKISSRKWVIDSVKSAFPEIWSKIKTAVDRESVYYEYICKGEVLNLPKTIGLNLNKTWRCLPKVKRLPKQKRKLI
jgi:hypothetical protein